MRKCRRRSRSKHSVVIIAHPLPDGHGSERSRAREQAVCLGYWLGILAWDTARMRLDRPSPTLVGGSRSARASGRGSATGSNPFGAAPSFLAFCAFRQGGEREAFPTGGSS